MEDYRIVELYWARNETAITETDTKYGRMLLSISENLLSSHTDSEECLNDTYLAAWNSMPDARPTMLGAFLSKIIRNKSLNRIKAMRAKKRIQTEELLDELEGCVSDDPVMGELKNGMLRDCINGFLMSLDEEKRYIFVWRYYYGRSISELATHFGHSEGRIKTALFRMREKLKARLEKEGLL